MIESASSKPTAKILKAQIIESETEIEEIKVLNCELDKHKKYLVNEI